MNSYGMEVFAEERRREALEEAEIRRLLRAAEPEPTRGRPWRARLALAVVRRLARVATATERSGHTSSPTGA
jgi:hypothetical protein